MSAVHIQPQLFGEWATPSAPNVRPDALGDTTIGYATAREILTRANGFMEEYDFTLNPYSGCSFGCTYWRDVQNDLWNRRSRADSSGRASQVCNCRCKTLPCLKLVIWAVANLPHPAPPPDTSGQAHGPDADKEVLKMDLAAIIFSEQALALVLVAGIVYLCAATAIALWRSDKSHRALRQLWKSLSPRR